MQLTPRLSPLAALCLMVIATPGLAQTAAPAAPTPVAAPAPDPAPAKKANDGTDPTQLLTTAGISIEHFDFGGGFWRDQLNADLTIPFGSGDRQSLRVRTPFVATNVGRERGYGFGDVQVRYTSVLNVTRKAGWVFQGEMAFDTAAWPELGTGKNVAKLTLIYARFLPGGVIFAPAVVHSESLWGRTGRRGVSVTTVDFYVVPKLANPRFYMTIDPSLTQDWVNDKFYPAAAVTLGYKLGPAMGGQLQAFVKPSVAAFGDRPFNWAMQAGVQLLGF
ncbi:hypothetical protein [Sandaracinobacteroides saxicola]|uniref:MipA/OmpV family protein n=1 Tax=Sandaracinobacteroides saxicola TaxID=2759707 RepID=A0A7G5II40_9SPHN|nr:hypothetical protein [Sandaracinobacteroides saxicola]QMW23032.1 hypothetical protein H3309_00505 [Sandaracinobacteroides saxicola]